VEVTSGSAEDKNCNGLYWGRERNTDEYGLMQWITGNGNYMQWTTGNG
jgi:hypothetical protein